MSFCLGWIHAKYRLAWNKDEILFIGTRTETVDSRPSLHALWEAWGVVSCQTSSHCGIDVNRETKCLPQFIHHTLLKGRESIVKIMSARHFNRINAAQFLAEFLREWYKRRVSPWLDANAIDDNAAQGNQMRCGFHLRSRKRCQGSSPRPIVRYRPRWLGCQSTWSYN